MKRFLVSILALAASLPASANDTTAVLTTGGLEFVVNDGVVVESEELFISKEEIRVVYEFRNETAEDQNVLVAFPMPDLVPNFYSPVAFPEGPDNNLFDFETLVDGQAVDATLHEYAFALGVDRTKLVKQLGLPLVSVTTNASDAVNALDADQQAQLLHLGMLSIDEFDDGSGWRKHFYPAWVYKATYTWEAFFPAGETVTVEHRYKPSVGGTVGVSFLSEPYEGYNPASEYKTKYCTDDAFISAVRKTLPNPAETWGAPFYESWISYVLTTGGNWGGRAIERFRLVVDKGDPNNLVSFCGEDVKKVSPTRFEMMKTDFWPQQELEILILERQPNSQ
jgi:hypothetical protein